MEHTAPINHSFLLFSIISTWRCFESHAHWRYSQTQRLILKLIDWSTSGGCLVQITVRPSAAGSIDNVVSNISLKLIKSMLISRAGTFVVLDSLNSEHTLDRSMNKPFTVTLTPRANLEPPIYLNTRLHRNKDHANSSPRSARKPAPASI